MKRLLTFFILLLSSFMLCGMTFAADSDIFILTGFKELPDPNWPYWKEVIILDEDEALTADMLPSFMRYENNEGGYAIRISWNVTDEALSEPGLHYVTGTPILPDDAVLADGFDGIATWPVFRTGEGVSLTVTPEQPDILNQLISQNGDPAAEVRFDTSESRCNVGEDGYIDVSDGISWQWDFSDVDTSTLGSYTITGTAILPDWMTASDDSSASYTVYVLPTDRIEIYGDVGLVGNRLEIYWLYDSSDVTNAVLELKTDDDQWTSCDESWYTFSNSYSPARLTLYPLNIPTETEHTLRLRYTDEVNGETVERYTEPIILTIPANIAELIENNISTSMTELGNGDRDGGDSGGSELPDYEQPAPKPETDIEIEQISEPVQEVVTDTYTAISGLRVAQLTSANSTVLFEKQGVSVEIPSELLTNLNLGDYDLLEVTIQNPQKNAIQIEIIAAGTPVEDLSGTVVYLPWNASDGIDLERHDVHGALVTKPIYDETSKTAKFEINAPGTYFITAVKSEPVSEMMEEPKAEEPDITPEPDETDETDETDDNIALYVGLGVGAFVILLLAAFVLWRWWRHD